MQESGADYVDASYRYGKTDTVSISHDKGVIVGFAKECGLANGDADERNDVETRTVPYTFA